MEKPHFGFSHSVNYGKGGHMKRASLVFGLCFLVLLFAGSLHGAVKNPDTFFVLADYRTVESIDPARSYDVAGSMRIWNLYETLIFFDGSSTEKFVPLVAAEIPPFSIVGTSVASTGMNSSVLDPSKKTSVSYMFQIR